METKRAIAGGGMALLVAAGLAWWLLPASGDQPAEPPAPAASAGPAAIALSAEQEKNLSLRLVAASAAGTAPLASLAATIDPPPNARVAVAAILPGVVTRTYVVEGDAVRRGQPLATVASRDVVMLGSDLERARAQLSVASASAKRVGQLASEGIVAGARADEARAAARQAQVDVREKSRILGMAHGSGASYTLTAPIAGRVSAMSVHTGDSLDGASAPFTIDAAGKYEVTAQLPERLVGQVRPGMTVRIAPGVEGKVTAVGTTIDPATRSATLRAGIPAGPGVIAGKSSTVTLLGPAPAGAVRVPAAAVTKVGGKDAVFVKTAKGFAVRQVEATDSDGSETVLLSGVKPGEQVAASGVSELKALALSQ